MVLLVQFSRTINAFEKESEREREKKTPPIFCCDITALLMLSERDSGEIYSLRSQNDSVWIFRHRRSIAHQLCVTSVHSAACRSEMVITSNLPVNRFAFWQAPLLAADYILFDRRQSPQFEAVALQLYSWRPSSHCGLYSGRLVRPSIVFWRYFASVFNAEALRIGVRPAAAAVACQTAVWQS